MLQRRSLRRVGGRLALLAVWLQLFLSLGHVHASSIYPFGHPVVQGIGATEIVAGQRSTPMPLAPLADSLAAEQACSICASMALAGSTVLPDPVQLPLPAVSSIRPFVRGPPVALKSPEFLLFQSRAPPLV